jgi:hypothetical protein
MPVVSRSRQAQSPDVAARISARFVAFMEALRLRFLERQHVIDRT